MKKPAAFAGNGLEASVGLRTAGGREGPCGLWVQRSLSHGSYRCRRRRRGGSGRLRSGLFLRRLFSSLFGSGLFSSRLLGRSLLRYFLGSLFSSRLLSSSLLCYFLGSGLLGRSLLCCRLLSGGLLCCRLLSDSLLCYLLGSGLLSCSLLGCRLLSGYLLSCRLLSRDFLLCWGLLCGHFLCSCHYFLLDQVTKSTSCIVG
jgi:hypothetical protein